MVTTRSADKRKDASENLALRSRKVGNDTPSATPTRKRAGDVSTPGSTRSKRIKASDSEAATPSTSTKLIEITINATEPHIADSENENLAKPIQVIVPPLPSSRTTHTPANERFMTPATSKHKRFEDDGDIDEDTIVVNQEPDYETANEVLDDSDEAPEIVEVSKAPAKGRKRRPKAADFLDDVVDKAEEPEEIVGALAQDEVLDEALNEVPAAATTLLTPTADEASSKEPVQDADIPQTLNGPDAEVTVQPALPVEEAAGVTESALLPAVAEDDITMDVETSKASVVTKEASATESPPELQISLQVSLPTDLADSTNADFVPLMTIPEVTLEEDSARKAIHDRALAEKLRQKQQLRSTKPRMNPTNLPATARSSLSKFRADKMRGRRSLEPTWKSKRSTFITS